MHVNQTAPCLSESPDCHGAFALHGAPVWITQPLTANSSITLVADSWNLAARFALTSPITAIRGHKAAVLGAVCLAGLASHSKTSNN
jgi:hypothetical protein